MVRPHPGRLLARRRRTVLLAVLLGTLVATAGCSGFVGSDDGATTPTTDAPAPTTTSTEQPADSPTRTTTDEPTGASMDVSGRMTVLVGESELDESVDTASFEYEPNERHTWTATGGTTLADALATLDVEASDGELAYDGETYEDGSNGTMVTYRVDGDPVDPTEYTLAADDEVWVTVQTPETNRSVPGEYIDDSDQHVHGHLEIVVEGETVDFGQEKYYSNDDYFHFHDGEPESWHAHSHNITLTYALSTFTGVEATDDSFTYDGTTYDSDDPDTSIRYEVNGESVTPSEYYVKDWDGIRVVVESDA